MSAKLSHIDGEGRAVMVDVTEKPVTERMARACGSIRLSEEVLGMIEGGTVPKGDVLSCARIAGIMAAKRTPELIPLCHILPLTSVQVSFEVLRGEGVLRAESCVKCTGRTGVEMEALTAVSAALLTVYDMCKAVDKRMVISDIHLMEKTGGRSGEFRF